jgi:hypothetical protein
MSRLLAGVVMLILAAAAASGASAGPITSPITSYNGVTVVKSAGAGQCGIRDEADFRDRLQKSLNNAGLALDRGSPVHARLSLDAKAVDSLEGQCVIFVRLEFTVPVETKFVEFDKRLPNRETVVAALKQSNEISALVYEDNEFNASWPINAHGEALYLVDQLAERFAGRK